MHYYDPMFYLCSKEMPFSIRIEAKLKEEIKCDLLEKAVSTAIRRYPYFSVRLEERDGDLVTVANDLPIRVFEGRLPFPLGSKELNGHLLALTYNGNTISFHMTHVMTDGAGFMPFMKTVLYYYLCGSTGTVLPDAGIWKAEDPFFPDEVGNPYPEEKMETALPFYTPPEKEFFRLTDGGYVKDDARISFNFRTKEADVMRFSHENDASPCALFSSIIAKAIHDVHPEEKRDIVSAVSFNLRPGLGNRYNYRMLCSSIPVRYSKKLMDSPVSKVCTCTRGSILVQSQSENVLYFAKRKKDQLESLLRLPDVQSKREVLAPVALADSVNNTFSVSYVGRIDYGALKEYIESIRLYTDGSVYRTIFLEISSFNGWFYLTLQQGFSGDIYYRAVIKQLRENGIEPIEDGCVEMDTADIIR